MASAIHAPQPSHSTPSFSRDSTQSFTSSQKQLYGEVSSSQSLNSSPTKSPPLSRGHPKKMSFSMGTYAPQNGLHLQHNGPRGYGDVNGSISYQQYPGGQKPQIYTAVYSGVQVYEMEVNNVFLMRRRHDSWLNATQILKVAGIDKGKRTKVLEKEILAGEHEKVQGGYGKYQGTWVNYQRGREFCRQYGVEELLRPLLEYDMGQDGVSQAGQGSIDTPTKEQAMAAQRKKMMYNGGIENRHPTQSPNATFFKSISATAANAVNAMNKTRIDSPGPRPASGNKRPQPAARRPSMQTASQESLFPGSSQQSMQSVHSDMTATATNGHLDPAFGSQSGPYFANPSQAHDSSFNEPPRKRVRRSSVDPFSQETTGGYDHSQEESTLVEDTSSFYHQAIQTNRNLDQAIIGVQPLPQPTSKRDLEKQQLLVALFLDHAQAEFRDHPTLNALSGEELDIPMDGTAHTALHWAATLGRTSLIRALIARGASIYRVNGGGETALIRAALTTNNLDQGTFPELLELLGPTIEMRDGRGRTVLHHIAMSSAVKGRSAACKYYLESLLEFVVRQGSASNSQHPSFNDVNDSSYPKPKCIGLARFMSEIVNAQDMSGDTALNLAARIGNKSIIQQLLEVGANPTIPNYGGLKPVDFGVGGDPDPNDSQTNSQTREQTAISKVGDASRDLTSSLTTLITHTESSFRSEIKQKQSLIDAAHSKLREASARLAEEKRQLADLERRTEERKLLKLRITNLRRANEEQKNSILRNGGTVKGAHEVKVGDADAGLDIDLAQLPSLNPDGHIPNLAPQQIAYLATLPSPSILNARISAYTSHNAQLEQEVSRLRNKSVELDRTLKKIVLLDLGLREEEMTEEMWSKVLGAWREDLKEGVTDERVREVLVRVRGVGA